MLKSFFKSNKFEISKFIIIGLFSTSLNFLVFNLFYLLILKINIASVLGYLVGLFNSLIFSKQWVFANSNKKISFNTFILFILIYLIGGIEMNVIINLIFYLFDNYKFAWCCGTLIAASNNYLGSKYLLFRN